MMNKAEAIKDILAECDDDYVGLWSIIKRVEAMGIDEKKLQPVTLELLSELLNNGKIVAGNFKGKTFQIYYLPTQSIIEMIDREWKKLNRKPNIGDIVWFTTPPAAA